MKALPRENFHINYDVDPHEKRNQEEEHHEKGHDHDHEGQLGKGHDHKGYDLDGHMNHSHEKGVFEICAMGHGNCEKCIKADAYQRCYYCLKNEICGPFIIKGFLGPDRDCPLVEQRVAICAFSLNAVFTPIYLACFALIGIGLIVVITLAIRNHCREKNQHAKMVKTHHINSNTECLSNGTMWEELHAEVKEREHLYSGYMIRSPRSDNNPDIASNVTLKTKSVQLDLGSKKGQRRMTVEERNGSLNQAGGRGGGGGGGGGGREVEMEDEKPVGKTGITTTKTNGQTRSKSTIGSTPTPGASSECSLRSTEKDKSGLAPKREVKGRSPALVRKSHYRKR